MNAEISMFVIRFEAIIYLLLYNLHDRTFLPKRLYQPKLLTNFFFFFFFSSLAEYFDQFL